MNQEIKELWLEALRSGEYEQGTGQLECDGDFCCLGVLCHLAAKAGIVKMITKECKGGDPTEATEAGCYFVDNVWAGSDATLPLAVIEWAGLSGLDSAEDPEVREAFAGRTRQLSYLNDNGYTFIEIADRIEKEL